MRELQRQVLVQERLDYLLTLGRPQAPEPVSSSDFSMIPSTSGVDFNAVDNNTDYVSIL